MTETSRSLFIVPVPGPRPVSPGTFTTNPGLSTSPIKTLQGKPMISDLVNAYSNLPQEARTYVEARGRKFAGDAINRATSNIGANGNNNQSGGSGNNRGGGGIKYSHSSGYALSKAPNPSETSLDSGIIPNTYTSDYLDAKENVCSPLHLTCVKLQFPTSVGNRLYDYFLKIVSFDVQTKAQANIGFNLNIASDFTDTKILAAMNSILNALMIYYYYMSIISYHSAYENKNEGMIRLRTSITANMLEDLSQLGRRISDTPVPPKLLELVRYLSSNYYSGPNQGSAMIKLVPHAATASMVDASSIPAALADLSLPANNIVYTLMRRSVPQWKPGILRDVPTNPSFDTNFLSIYANLPQITNLAGTGLDNLPITQTTTETITYNSFTNVLDGVAYSLTAINVFGLGYLPSLITPLKGGVGFEPNRRSFYEVATVKGFYNAIDYTFLVRSRPESYQINDSKNAVLQLHLAGADKCLGVSSETVRETCMLAVDYLMSLDTIRNANVRGNINNPTAMSMDGQPRGNKRPGKKRGK